MMMTHARLFGKRYLPVQVDYVASMDEKSQHRVVGEDGKK